MKKILVSLYLLSLLALPVVGLAQGAAPTDVPDVDVIDVLENVVNWLFTILLIFAAIMIVVAAYMFVTAAGNPETVAKARHFVIYALIGVAVAAVARGLIVLVKRIVGAD